MSSSRNSNSGSNSSHSSGNFPITIEAKAVGFDAARQSMMSIVDASKLLQSQFKSQMSTITSYNTMLSNMGRSFSPLNQGFTQGAQGAQRFNQALQQSSNTLRQGQTTLNQFMNTQRQTAQTAQQASAAEQTLTQNTQRLNQTFTQTTETLGRAQGQLMNLNKNAQQTANTMRNATAQTKMYDAALFESNTALTQSTDVTENHTKSTKSNTDAIINNMRHISALGMGFMMLSNTMSDSELVQENIAMQQERLAEAHKRTEQALKEHGKASTQYQQAAQAEAKITRGLAFEQREATAQQHNMLFMQAMIASEIMSSAVPALLKYKETWTQLKGGISAFRTALEVLPSKLSGLTAALGLTSAAAAVNETVLTSAGAAATKTSVQMGVLSTAEMTTFGTSGVLSGALAAMTTAAGIAANAFRALWVAITGPIGLLVIGVITAIVAAVALLRDNTFGVRDSFNALGAKLGEMVPALKGPLDMIKGIAGALGLSGEKTEEWQAALKRGFKEGRESMDPFFDALEKGLNLADAFFQAIINDGSALVEGFKKWAAEGIAFITDINTWKNAWSGLVKTASAAGADAIKAIQEVFDAAGTWIFGQEKWASFLSGAQVAANDALDIIQKTFSGLASWVDEHITKPISNAIKNAQPPPAEVGPSADLQKQVSPTESMAKDVDEYFKTHPQVTNSKGQSSATAYQRRTSATAHKTAMSQYIEPALQIAEGHPPVKPAPQTSADRSQLLSPGPATTFFGMDVQKARQDILNAANNPQGAGTKLRQGLSNIITPQTANAATTATTTAIDDQTAKLKKLAEAQEDSNNKEQEAIKAGAALLLSHKGMASQLPNNIAQLTAISQAVGTVSIENDKLSTTLNNNALALQNNALQGELQRKGMLDQRKALQDMQMQIETNKGTLEEYAKQVEDGTILGYAFTLGQQEQRKALLDSQVEVANTNGMLQEYALQLESGKIQQVAFTQGQQEIKKQFMDTQVETVSLNGQYSELVTRLNDVGTAQIEYNNGLAKGRVETAQTVIGIDAMRGSYDGTRQVLLDATKGQLDYTTAQKLSNDQLMEFVEVAKGAPDALKNLVDWITNLGSSIRSNLADAMREGSDEFKDAIDDLEDSLGFKLGKEVTTTLKFVAKVDEAKQKIMEGLGVLSILISVGADKGQIIEVGRGMLKEFESQFEEGGKNVGNGMIDNLKEQWEGRESEITALFSTIQQNIQTIMTAPPGSAEFIQAWEKLKLAMEAANGNLDSAIGLLNDANSGFNTLGTTMSNTVTKTNEFGTVTVTAGVGLGTMATNTQNLGDAAAKADPQVKSMFDTLVQLGGIGSLIQQTFEVNFPVAVSTGVTTAEGYLVGFQGFFGNIFGQLINTSTSSFSAIQVNFGTTMGQMINTSSASFTAMAEHPKLFSAAVDTEFGKAADDGTNLIDALDAAVSKSFDNMAEYPSVVSEAVDQEFGKAADDGKNLIQALERAVKSSCDAMASAFGKVSDAVDKIGESAQNAESDVDSLKSAVESLPNIERTITYHIETEGSKPAGAQFGTNMLVDKPQMLLVGEGFGKERVKVSPGTMPFAEDFTREMNHKFEVQRSVSGQPGQPGTNANGTSTNNGTSISTPGQPGANGQPGTNGSPGASGVNNVYAPGYQGVPTNQNNNPDLGGGLGTGMMINSNASLVAMNNANGKKMIVDGRTGTVIMLNGSSSSSNTNTNTNTGSGSSNSGDIVGQNNNVNVDNDTNSKNNVYIPGSSGITQSQSNSSQSGSSGGNYYYQSQTNNGVTRVNSNIPAPPGMVNESAASSGNIPVSGSYSSDSRSRLLSRGDPFGFQTRVVHETPVEVNIDLEGVKLAKKIIKILTEEMGWGSGYYG